jgi:hypothetical protein
MFYLNQDNWRQKEYQENLELIGSLSNLFSESDVPFLHYRIVETLFCKSFNAEDLSRSDLSADAKKDELGIGVKTFRNGNSKSFQKVAEFNKSILGDKPTPQKIAELRNRRIDATEIAHGLKRSIYHCVLRESNRFKLFEEPMHKINISSIHNINFNKGSIHFEDNKEQYSYSLSKSTLFKRFNTEKIVDEFEVRIIKNPLDELKNLLKSNNYLSGPYPLKTIYLPLYGLKNNKRYVFERSGLNQWNAKGRVRHPNEIYIPIPIKIHRLFSDFFPPRDTYFSLKFPDGEIVDASVCQAGGKALMTKQNKKLGKLILRDILKLKEGKLVTYGQLELLGIDSVQIYKISEYSYEINFAKCDSYEKFIARSIDR